jgi:5-methylcytosine-specific restriction endonuclease McrBC regulatory subunit McrC
LQSSSAGKTLQRFSHFRIANDLPDLLARGVELLRYHADRRFLMFEEYVARMLARALVGTGRQVVAQGGRLYCLESGDGAKLFQTKPDILIKRDGAVELVIDTKWKRIARRIDDPKQGVAQADIYQMMAYGRLYQCPRLMLLYTSGCPD